MTSFSFCVYEVNYSLWNLYRNRADFPLFNAPKILAQNFTIFPWPWADSDGYVNVGSKGDIELRLTVEVLRQPHESRSKVHSPFTTSAGLGTVSHSPTPWMLSFDFMILIFFTSQKNSAGLLYRAGKDDASCWKNEGGENVGVGVNCVCVTSLACT